MRWCHSINASMILKKLVYICGVMDVRLNLDLILCFILQFYFVNLIKFFKITITSPWERSNGWIGGCIKIGGCVKNMVYCAVLLKKVVIHSPEDFPRYADSNIKVVLVVFIQTSEVKEEPDFIQETPYVDSMCTLKSHMAKSFKMKAGGFYYLLFFKDCYMIYWINCHRLYSFLHSLVSPPWWLDRPIRSYGLTSSL